MEAGKAVRIGRGPATVIGCKAVSQATLPRRGIGFSREKRGSEPRRHSQGAFLLLRKFSPSREVVPLASVVTL